MPTGACVYILASTSKRLYIGITTNIERRLVQHRAGTFPDSFTDRYNIHHLVHIEHFALVASAITREKQLKRWSRLKKLHLIATQNPTWEDLSFDWGKPFPIQSGLHSPLPPSVISTEAHSA
jgi:putative endonuclease